MKDTQDILKSLKLADTFDFKEVQIGYTDTIIGMHNVLTFNVMPAIIEMDSLINSFHFIRHELLDLRLSSPCWDSHGDRIREILAKHSLPTEMHPYETAKPEKFGGDIGRVLGYNVLEHNSRIVLAVIAARWEADSDAQDALLSNIHTHWPHYLYLQYGFNHVEQAVYDFDNAMRWIDTALVKGSDHPHTLRVVSYILDEIGVFMEKCSSVYRQSDEEVEAVV